MGEEETQKNVESVPEEAEKTKRKLMKTQMKQRKMGKIQTRRRKRILKKKHRKKQWRKMQQRKKQRNLQLMKKQHKMKHRIMLKLPQKRKTKESTVNEEAAQEETQ